MANLSEVSATGTVTSSPAFVHSVVLTSGDTDACSVILRDGGGSGTRRLTLKAPVSRTVVWTANSDEGAQFFTDVHATVSGTNPVADVEYH